MVRREGLFDWFVQNPYRKFLGRMMEKICKYGLGEVLGGSGALGRCGHVDFDCSFGSGFAVTDGAVDGAVVGAG